MGDVANESLGRGNRRGSAAEAKPRQPADVRKQQIADVALRIIASRGLRHFTAKAIGRELGLTDAAIFRHLPTKRAIVQAAIDRVEQLLFDEFPPRDDDPITRLGRFFRKRAQTVAGHPGLARLMFSEDLAHAGGPEENRRVLAFKRRSAAFVSDCLEEARQRGLLSSRVMRPEGALILMGSLMAFVFSIRGRSDGADIALRAGRLWSTLEAFLRGAESAGKGAQRMREEV